jgi:hypothetical protein
MRSVLIRAATADGGAISREEATRLVPRHVVDDALKAGALIRLFPQAYVLPELAGDRDVRRRAALLYRPDASLSHLDSLTSWLPSVLQQSPSDPVHLTCTPTASNKAVAGVVLHRRASFRLDPPETVRRRGLRLVPLEQAIVESWPLIRTFDRRSPAIVAVRERRTTAERLSAALARNGRVSGAADMRRLFELLGEGVHSELELWGHEQVFSDPRLPAARLQVPVTLLNGEKVYLDRLHEAELVDVELDGAAYHGRPGQRERDIRRDVELSRLGYLPIRFSHQRLFHSPAEVVEELLDVLAMRRRQLGLRPA